MESYQTEEEQLEALRRWWNENGRSIVAAVVIALAGTFGWQSWQSNKQQEREYASDVYQAMLHALGTEPGGLEVSDLANQLKGEYSSSTYAQFAALHLAALAVNEGNLAGAESELRWVLGKAAQNSDTGQVAQLRLARVLAASGDVEQALAILSGGSEDAYTAAYAVAEGDILLAAGRKDEALTAYTRALSQAATIGGGVNLPALQQKMQSLAPVPAREAEVESGAEPVVEVIESAEEQ